MSNRDKLLKLMQENPDLPVVFACTIEELGECGWTFYKDFSCDVVDIYETEEEIYDDEIDVKEYYEYLYSDEYEDLSNEEFNKKIQELINEIPHYKAIRVFCK